MIQTSNFYSNLTKLEAARQAGISNLTAKGVEVASNSSIPAVMNKILQIQPAFNITGDAVIITAEMPNVTIQLLDGDLVLDTKQTNATHGGIVTFALTSTEKTYTIAAYSGETLLWTNTITINGPGVFNCKTGKAFADYTEAEVNMAAKNYYAKYMWSVGDTRMITTVGSSRKWAIGAFEHDNLASGGKAGMTMIMESYTSASYKHWNSSDNKIGWEGSLIRKNGLKYGDIYYTRETVTEATAGTFYVYSTDADAWVQKTLPADYDANEVYYTQNTMDTNGAFITGLPDWQDYIVPVIKETADAGKDYKKIIKSIDNVFLLSDGEVFGNAKRYSTYSKYELEGQQYEYFKNNFSDGKVALGYSCWLRSPYSGTATSFCYVYTSGYMNNSIASNTNCARLAFCL